MVYLVFQSTWLFYCLPSMFDFDGICGVPELGHFIVYLRCLILMLFVVAGHTFGDHCFSSMLDSDAICRGRRHF